MPTCAVPTCAMLINDKDLKNITNVKRLVYGWHAKKYANKVGIIGKFTKPHPCIVFALVCNCRDVAF